LTLALPGAGAVRQPVEHHLDRRSTVRGLELLGGERRPGGTARGIGDRVARRMVFVIAPLLFDPARVRVFVAAMTGS
jgi:hypothetical protein